MRAVLFDLDGVLYEGSNAIDGAARAVHWFQKQHIPYLFLTNTSSRPRSSLVEKLASFDITTTIDDFLTPAVAACDYLHQRKPQQITLFIPELTRQEFSDFDQTDEINDSISAVIIGDLAQAWTFERLNKAFNILMRNPQAELIALGMTRYWRSESGLQLDAGPFVRALEYASGRKAVVTGKPAEPFYQSAMAILKQAADEILMIGDDIYGDIQAANDNGFHSVLVRTGKFTETDLTHGIRPDAIIDSVAALPDYWQTLQSSQR